MGKQRKQRQTLFSWLCNNCRWWLQPLNKKMLAPCSNSYDQPRQHIKKQKHYFANKGPSSQSYDFSSTHVCMYVCESWTTKKAEGCFNLWCWRRLLRAPWTARRSNQSILKEISPEYSLEGVMLKLKLQYFGHLMRRTNSFEKALILGKIEGRRRGWRQRVRWMASLTRGTWAWEISGSWWWTGKPGTLQSIESQRVRHNWATELNWLNMPSPEASVDSIIWNRNHKCT